MPEPENVALFDMDGTICDYDRGLFSELERLRSLGEPVQWNFREVPVYIQNRIDLIQSSEDWWANLERLKLGFDVLEIAKELDYRVMILTQGPRRCSAAWAGKKRWLDKHLGDDVDVTMTLDKGLVYGRVLVDDYPKYIERWLTWRKNGQVIMPANHSNEGFEHPQVLRYDGSNLDSVREAMERAKH